MNLGIIGSGRAAWAFASTWKRIGWPVVGVATRGNETTIGPRRSIGRLLPKPHWIEDARCPQVQEESPQGAEVNTLLGRASIAVAAAGRHDRTIEAFAVGTTKRIPASRIEVGRKPRIRQRRRYAGTRADSQGRTHGADPGRRRPRDGIGAHDWPGRDGRVDPRRHRWIDGRRPRPDIEIGRAHDALRMNRRGCESHQRQKRRRQNQCRAACLHQPIRAIVNHGTSAFPGRAGRPYGVATARLTIFSRCSLLSRPAASSLLIALLPNCRRNMPPLAPSTIEAW